MSTILIIIVVILLLGGSGGYYVHGRYGGAGLGDVLGLVVLVLVLVWLFGGLGGVGRTSAERSASGLLFKKGYIPLISASCASFA
jgi:hypothetical protein